MLNPVFSLANMRSLLPEIQPIADVLLKGIRGEIPHDGSGSYTQLCPLDEMHLIYPQA